MPKRQTPTRNDTLFDAWSIVHVIFGIIFGLVFEPFTALVLLVLWEPLEILVLSPLLALKGIVFGHESLRNSLSDIVFDIIGVLIAVLVLKP